MLGLIGMFIAILAVFVGLAFIPSVTSYLSTFVAMPEIVTQLAANPTMGAIIPLLPWVFLALVIFGAVYWVSVSR